MHTVGLPRTCLGFTNILFFIFGFVGFIICVWCAVNTQFFQDVNYTVTKSSHVDNIANFVSLKLWLVPMTSILIPITVIAMMTSCCGILGAGCKLKCAIKSYIFLVTVLSSVAFWIFFISGIYNIYTNNEKTRNYLRTTIITNYGEESDMITYLWNYVMINYECCGVNSYKDFAYSNWGKQNTDKLYPVQCCILENRTALIPVAKDCNFLNGSVTQTHKDIGCFYALRQAIIRNKASLIFYVVLLLIFYIILTLFSYCIMKGEPLLGAMAGQLATFLPRKNIENDAIPTAPSISNMYVDEPPKKMVRVVSAVNPFQTYKLAPNAYGYGDNAYQHNFRPTM